MKQILSYVQVHSKQNCSHLHRGLVRLKSMQYAWRDTFTSPLQQCELISPLLSHRRIIPKSKVYFHVNEFSCELIFFFPERFAEPSHVAIWTAVGPAIRETLPLSRLARSYTRPDLISALRSSQETRARTHTSKVTLPAAKRGWRLAPIARLRRTHTRACTSAHGAVRLGSGASPARRFACQRPIAILGSSPRRLPNDPGRFAPARIPASTRTRLL